MDEPTIICPTCKNDIKLTESLATPLIESTRKEYEGRLAQKDIDLAKCKKARATAQSAEPITIAGAMIAEKTVINSFIGCSSAAER